MYEVCTNSSGVFIYTNTSATQHTLRDLPPNTVVTFSVRAYTIIGPGEYVTGQASTESVCKYIECAYSSNTVSNNDMQLVFYSLIYSKCQSNVIRRSKQYISKGLLDSSQPDSGVPLHCTLHYSGRG